MSAGIVADAVDAVAQVRDARHLRAFKHAVAAFTRAVGSVPDEGAEAVTSDQGRMLQLLGQDVIDLIEERVADALHGGDAQALVSAVYEIRRLLEEVHRFRLHYAIARPV